METYSYKQQIDAPAQKVWDILWNTGTYQQWTAAFTPGSTMESDWKVAGRTRFLDGKGNGMVSTIRSIQAPEELVFEHLGSIENGVEDTTSDAIKEWAGSLERYYLKEEGGITTLEVLVDVDPKYKEMMDNGFMKGLETVRTLAEQ
ncbi:SRPBCC domain-containing protein [Niabella pedocola]|uniref:SRPBCC domain-containing protein n=1 Tax=Niabella pedocola TaxID=1752077 RepID=A0ABS8PQC9_9BACT|nr:SRPBCC domain-containing protein [Niabella pedocola]MCD2423279.1 SRPBCC domain-containing protein [Niabella pedocola]